MAGRRLPPEKRDVFQEPVGYDISEEDLPEINAKHLIIAVGDVVSLTMRRNGIVPLLSVYDGFTERHEVTGFADLVKNGGLAETVVSNPPGEITSELVDAVKNALAGRSAGRPHKNTYRTAVRYDGGVKMKMEIKEQKDNVLQERTEVCFVIDHAREATPGRNAVAEELAKQFNTKRNLVIVDDLKSVYGVGKTNGYAKIYKSEDLAKKYENEYLLKRNGYSDKPAEEEAQE